jgi:hypothetical protein
MEITNWPNGDRKVITKERNGTVTELTTRQNGSKQETVTKPDGSSNSVVIDTRGVQVETATTSEGEIKASVRLPQGVTQARITIPVPKASVSTVAVRVREDGTRSVLGTSLPADNGISFTAKGDMTVQIIENPVAFTDVPGGHWAAEAVAFTASRGFFTGTEQGTFAPEVSVSRAMLFTVLGRLEGVETEGGDHWYSKAQDWASASGISDGSAPEAVITREQLVTILHRYAGQPTAAGAGRSFADSGDISPWAQEAMDWAVHAGILNGNPENRLEPAGVATRAEVSAMLMRFVVWKGN